MRDQPGFFEVDDRLKRLSDLGDQLEGFRAAVDFEMFRPDLDAALAYSDGAQGGRPPRSCDDVQGSRHSDDEQTLGLTHRVPDQRSLVVHAPSLDEGWVTSMGVLSALAGRVKAMWRVLGNEVLFLMSKNLPQCGPVQGGEITTGSRSSSA